jgi:UDPglucose--hexose-1-phosphate uridylyltransferase
MSEIRKHHFLDEYCIIAPRREKRPSEASKENTEKRTGSCVFCAGGEHKTPPANAVYRDNEILKDSGNIRIKNWEVRCIPNLYPALSPDAAGTGGDPEALPGYGFHEVIVETPLHGREVPDFSDREMDLLMRVYRDRVVHYGSMDRIEYVSLFKNRGMKAGASLSHTHSQLIAMPVQPPLLLREMEKIRTLPECPYCDIVDRERTGERLLYENNGFVVIAPYCSKVPFELWLIPKKHISHLAAFSDGLLHSLGDAIRFSVSCLRNLGDIAYNYMFFQLQEETAYHFNLKLQPVTSTAAGFEKNTNVFINTMPPEKAVEQLRGGAD